MKTISDDTWKIVGIVLSSVAFVLIFTVTIWKLRKKGYCGGRSRNPRTHRNDHQVWNSDYHGLSPSEPQTSPQRPSNPTILRTASIPTYRECLDGSDRVVAENNYVTLPTDEPRPPSNNNRTVDDLPPTYEVVQENQNLYAVADV